MSTDECLRVQYYEDIAYYDGPLLFFAEDVNNIEQKYIASAAVTEEEPYKLTDNFVVIKLENSEVEDFKNNKVCLRTLLENRINKDWYMSENDNVFDNKWTLKLIKQEGDISENQMPEYKFYYKNE